MLTTDTFLFFDKKQEELTIYEALLEKMESRFGAFRIKVSKTQISFYSRYMFGCASFTRVKKKAEMPEHFLTVTFGLDHPLQAERIAVCTEAARNRWTHHVVIGCADEIDDELLGWLTEAYEFSNRK